MRVNAMTEEFEHIKLLGKPVLFTESRMDTSTVPDGWYCYDLRGTDDDPGIPGTLEPLVVVNHAGTILSPEVIPFAKGKDYRDVRGKLNFLGEEFTLAGYCEHYGMETPADPGQYALRPASPDEAGLFYSLSPERDAELGCIGHVRIDFGRSGNEFWHSWWPRGPEELNSPEFKAELQTVVDALRKDILSSLSSMRRYCWDHNGAIEGGWSQNYGYIVETEHYRYCLRCNPVPGDYQAYLTAYDLDIQRQNMAQEEETVEQPEFNQGMTLGGI